MYLLCLPLYLFSGLERRELEELMGGMQEMVGQFRLYGAHRDTVANELIG